MKSRNLIGALFVVTMTILFLTSTSLPITNLKNKYVQNVVFEAYTGFKKIGDTVIINISCDSILHIPKIADNPAIEFKQAVRDRNLHDLRVLVSENVARFGDYSSNDEMYNHWHAHDIKSTFWEYLDGCLKLDGGYISDSVYILPMLANLPENQKCNLEYTLVTLLSVQVHSGPNLNSSVLSEIPMHRILYYSPNMSVIPYENYDSMIYPSIEQFDDEVWYYLSEYNGYVQNRNVIDIYYTPIMYFERSESGQWLLSDMINIY